TVREWRAVMLATVLLAALASPARSQLQGIRNTKHNLSATSGNTIRATSEGQVCVFCHTPHSSRTDAPLWNRSMSAANYQPYASPSLQGMPGQPNGASKLCLSCHDGSIAIGSVLNPPNPAASSTIAMTGTGSGGTMPAGRTLLGTNLQNDHPVSFIYDGTLTSDDGELVDPSVLTGTIRLHDGATPGVRNAVQCITCHDPHTDQLPKFLRRSARGRANNLCIACHQKSGWSGSTHEASTRVATIDGVSATVSDHACVGCHAPHTVDGAERLLRDAAVSGASAIERACYQCHGAAGPGPNVQGEIAKSGSKHPVESSASAGAHRPVFTPYPPAGLPENVALRPGTPAPDSRYTDALHVECVDCHNPHRVTAANTLEGMRGISLSGSVIESVRNDSSAAGTSEQYAVCLRCHGDTYTSALPPVLASGLSASNKRAEFQPSNSSYHPVGAAGRNQSSNLNAQLTPYGLRTTSMIRCTDCHNSNAYGVAGGKVVPVAGAPSGPHGSTNRSVLRANYRSTLNVSSYNPGNFALCYLCHNESALLGNSTNFYDTINGKGNLHALHLRDRTDKTGAICKSCHFNIHSNVASTTTQYTINGVTSVLPPNSLTTRLVNFHPNVRGTGGRPRAEWWLDTGTRERRCYLACHDVQGNPGGQVMDGTSSSNGAKRAQYRPSSGDVP
ncbi:MAG TPA: cytochrome c3 family protein, partial [Gemmatimonadaceae bacterium]|nr:cytochrome c3 family protein [Gemmatimonadaceae bacterium]